MRHIVRRLLQLLESYIAVMGIALAVGLLFPHYAVALAPYTTTFLQGIFFLAGLKLDLADVRRQLRQPLRTLIAVTCMLVLFPLAAYPTARALAPSTAIGILLLAASPSAMSAPLYASLAGGSEAVALVLTVTTSLLAPVTIPIVAKLLVGTSVTVDAFAMFRSLAFAIFLPLAVAQVIRRGLHVHVRAASFTFKPLSILLLGLIITAITARYADRLLASLDATILVILASLSVFTIATHVVGYALAVGRGHRERVAYAVALAYMNIVLAIYLAGRFFPDPVTILTTVLALIFWTLVFVPFRVWAIRHGARAVRSRVT